MAELALGAGDLEPVGMGPEDLLHGEGLGQVAERGAGAVGVDVIDGIRGEPASSRQRFIARAAPRPSSSGAVMCQPSADMP